MINKELTKIRKKLDLLDNSFLETRTVPLKPGVVGLNFNNII